MTRLILRWASASLLFSGAVWVAGAGCGSDASEPPSSTIGGNDASAGSSSGGSSAAGGGGQGGSGAGSSGGSGGSSGSSSSGGSGGSLIIDSGLSDAVDPDAACATVTEKASAKQLNLYIMLDKSSSMAGYKWDAVKEGLEAFVMDATSEGINVGLNFYPRDADAQPECSTQAYKDPRVAFDLLPTNAQPIVTELGAEAPNGASTPTYPALGGALLKAAELGQQNPDQTSAVLLVTDGLPKMLNAQMCGMADPEDPAAIAQLAANGFAGVPASGIPSIPTYVVALEGVDSTFANQVASSGGTDSALIISSTNAAQDFENALKAVRGEALPCEYAVPSEVTGGQVAFDRVNVLFTPESGMAETIPQTDDCTTADGWYYDDPQDPTQILLCSGACTKVKDDFDAQLDILLGCETVTVK